jgi:hypothetical protein
MQMEQRVGEFTVEDVVTMLHDPMYGYGRVLAPQEGAVGFFVELNKELAEECERWGRLPTIDELDSVFSAALVWLVDEGICQHVADIEPLVGKELWLRAQLGEIRRITLGLAS